MLASSFLLLFTSSTFTHSDFPATDASYRSAFRAGTPLRAPPPSDLRGALCEEGCLAETLEISDVGDVVDVGRYVHVDVPAHVQAEEFPPCTKVVPSVLRQGVGGDEKDDGWRPQSVVVQSCQYTVDDVYPSLHKYEWEHELDASGKRTHLVFTDIVAGTA
ncbi:hypothetical protein BC830DRAFT_1084931 [Chytriomyces sp. MP71]|nr:hypothetical protein BC830DRAFT_1084931 [Chytriomyces sp. MP71]